MLMNKSLKAKILSSFLIVCLGLGIVAVTGFYALKEVGDKYSLLAKISVPNLGHISGMRSRGRQIHAESVKLALYWDNAAETTKTLESLSKATKRYEEITAEKLQEPFTEGEEEVFKNVEAKYVPVKASVEEVLRLFKSEDPDKINKIKTTLVKFEEEVREHQSSLLKLDDYHVERGENWSKEAFTISSRMQIFLSVIAVLTLFAALALAYFISKNINQILMSVAERLKNSSDRVAQSSQQVAHASHELSEGNTEQAEALHETVSSTNEIAAMTEKTSDNARESLKRAELSQRASTKGQDAIEQMVNAISDIGSSNAAMNTQIKKGNLEIQEIVNLILEIGQKTKLIDDIVFQTKLLSFNVSVEAARAGEHGKGFAVVAEEMSNLADMSGRASKEISAMLTQTTQKAMSVVESNKANVDKLMTVGEEKLNMGSHVAKTCKVALDEIIHYVDEMCTMIKETTHSTQEQARGVAEINKAMGQIDTVTSQNAHASKECSEAAVQLMSEVDRTKEVINDLLRVIHGRVDEFETVHVHKAPKKSSRKADDFDDKHFAA
jgi:methyl-accepting chemotaxis protein